MNKSCPKCGSSQIRKNGHRGEKQNYQCKDCKRQFVEFYSEVGYSKEFKEECIKMYLNGSGFRAIERVKKVNHNTVIRWVKEAAEKVPPPENNEPTPLVGQIDELQTFIGQKSGCAELSGFPTMLGAPRKNKIWLWTSVNKFCPHILAYTIGDRSSKTFLKLWEEIKHWNCYFWVTDNYIVYKNFIPDEDHIISKTYRTRIEGENTRLRHYLARLHRKTLCYSKSEEMLDLSVKLLLYYLKNQDLSQLV